MKYSRLFVTMCECSLSLPLAINCTTYSLRSWVDMLNKQNKVVKQGKMPNIEGKSLINIPSRNHFKIYIYPFGWIIQNKMSISRYIFKIL